MFKDVKNYVQSTSFHQLIDDMADLVQGWLDIKTDAQILGFCGFLCSSEGPSKEFINWYPGHT